MASTTVKKHSRANPGKRKAAPRPRGMKRFSLVFDLDLAPLAASSPDRVGGKSARTFVLQVEGLTWENVLRYVNKVFDFPHIVAAFEGYPAVVRGEVITSMADVVARYGPAALHAREQSNMISAMTRKA